MMTLIQHFHFIRPWWLLALLPLALLWIFLNKIQRKTHNWTEICDPHLLPYLLIHQKGTRGLAMWILIATGWLLAVLALAGPSWTRLPQPVYKHDLNRVIVFDLSNDMRVADIAPSRLIRARYKLMDLLQQSKEGQTGLVVYSGEPYVVSPLTNDTNTIIAMVPDLDPSLMPVQGNNLTAGLSLAAKLLKQNNAAQGEIIVVTASQVSQAAIDKAKLLVKEGVKVSVLGVGTNKNTPVMQQNGQFLQDEKGAIVFTKLDTTGLQALAEAGQGNYVLFSNDDSDISKLLESLTVTANFKADKDKAITDLWQDEGRWLIWPLLIISLLAFRRGWLGGRR